LLKIILDPPSSDALEFIDRYHKSKPDKTLLLLVGDCMVDYHGRARSLLDWGERVVIIKQDGNILVHQPVMHEPVNWQPSGSKTKFNVEDEQLVLRSRHTKPPEKMKIIFRSLKLIMVTSLCDQASLTTAGMETDVVNDIISNPDIVENGLHISKREKHVKSGTIDLFGYGKNHAPVVIEVKHSLANISAVHKLRMHVNDVKRDVDEAEIRGILCAPRVPDMVKKLLADYGLEQQEVKRRVVLLDDRHRTLKDL